MGAEFLAWKYRPALLMTVLFFVLFNTNLTSTENRVGKLYSRGNHWAVGHLMGKKSTGSVESQTARYQPLQPPEHDKQLERYLQTSSLVTGIVRVLTSPERENPVISHRHWLWTRRESGRKDRKDRNQHQGD